MRYAMKWGVLALSSALVVACHNDNDSPVNPAAEARFEVRLTNLTNAQPMSPVAVIMHKSGFNSFIDGQIASGDLETLAEGGDNSAVLAQAQAAIEHVASGSTAGPVGPRSISDAVVLNVPTDELSNLRLSVITMLVHTNDGFTGTNARNISNMTVGQSMTIGGPVWDSGTEANNELGSAMPGPDFGGEGFNAVRDDIINRVRIHQGAVSNASVEAGLPTSDLEDHHRFLNPGSRIVITRTQ